MYLRLALGGIAWLAILALFAASLQQRREPPGLAKPDQATALVRALNGAQARGGDDWWSWRVVRATSAHRVMIVDVEALRLAEASAIAVQVVEPVRAHGYEEILIYVRQAGAGDGAATRRIQWTPRGGFSELVISR